MINCLIKKDEVQTMEVKSTMQQSKHLRRRGRI